MEREHLTPVGKFQVHAYEAGTGEPFVFLHGWSQHAASSERLQRMLAHRYRVFAPSHIGFGKSSPLPKHGTFTIADYAQIYIAWLTHLGIQNFTLVGHSLGGAIAQVIAATAPAGTVKRLILIDTLGVRFQRSEMQWTWQWLQKEALNLWTAPQHQARYLVKPFLMHLLTRPRNLFTLSELSKTLDIQEYSASIHVPTTIMWGDADTFIPSSVGERLAASIPGSTFVTIPGGHDWPLLNPEPLLGILE